MEADVDGVAVDDADHPGVLLDPLRRRLGDGLGGCAGGVVAGAGVRLADDAVVVGAVEVVGVYGRSARVEVEDLGGLLGGEVAAVLVGGLRCGGREDGENAGQHRQQRDDRGGALEHGSPGDGWCLCRCAGRTLARCSVAGEGIGPIRDMGCVTCG